MTMEEYKENYFKRWQRRIAKQCWAIFILLTVLTIALTIFLYAFPESGTPTVPFKFHLVVRVVIPELLQITTLILLQNIISKKNISPETKCRIVILAFFSFMSTVSVFYNSYPMTMLLPGLTMLLAAMVTDKKMLRTLLILSIIILAVSFVTWHSFFSTNTLKDQIISVLLILASYGIVFRIAQEILRTQKAQIEFVSSNYEKQLRLAEELKLEPLTRLYNRQALSDTVNNLLKLFQTKDDQACLVFFDLDNFKGINDKYGHAAGDAVLISLSEIIIKVMGTNRNAFRYGGDEFVLLFHEKNLAEIICCVESIMNDFKNLKLDFLPSDVHCSMSVGIAQYQKGYRIKEWFKAADDAAYKAKQNGKNRYEIAD